MQDPFQAYQTAGMYSGMTPPSISPYSQLQALQNPAAALNPFAAISGISGINPGAGTMQGGQPYGLSHHIGIQQLQAAALLAAQAANPQLLGLSPLGMGNPIQALLANPLIAASLQNPYINAGVIPFLNGGQQNPFYGGQQNPYQSGIFGNPLLGIGIAGNPFFAGLQNPTLNPLYTGQNPFQSGLFGHPQHGQMGQIGSQVGQFGQLGQYPYAQAGYPLAPQSWVGQGGPYGGGQYGQIHPLLQQIGMRTLQNPGAGSWI